MLKAKLYASSLNISTIRNTWMQAPTSSRLICGAPLLFSLPQDSGSRWRSAISEVVSAGSMVKDSQAPATPTMMAMLMNAPPQPGAMESNT